MKIRKLYYMMALVLPIAFSSCEDYLDKAVDAEITEDDVFRKFVTFQGFAEDMYQCVVDIANRDIDGMNNWNWGDEFLPGIHTERMGKNPFIAALSCSKTAFQNSLIFI